MSCSHPAALLRPWFEAKSVAPVWARHVGLKWEGRARAAARGTAPLQARNRKNPGTHTLFVVTAAPFLTDSADAVGFIGCFLNFRRGTPIIRYLLLGRPSDPTLKRASKRAEVDANGRRRKNFARRSQLFSQMQRSAHGCLTGCAR